VTKGDVVVEFSTSIEAKSSLNMAALQRVDRNKTSRPGIFKRAPDMILNFEYFLRI